MKKLLFAALLAAVVGILAVSCKKDETSQETNVLEGTSWKYSDGKNDTAIITFTTKKECKITVSSYDYMSGGEIIEKDEGMYTVKKDIVYIDWDRNGSWEGEIVGEKILMEVDGQTLTFKKRG